MVVYAAHGLSADADIDLCNGFAEGALEFVDDIADVLGGLLYVEDFSPADASGARLFGVGENLHVAVHSLAGNTGDVRCPQFDCYDDGVFVVCHICWIFDDCSLGELMELNGVKGVKGR